MKPPQVSLGRLFGAIACYTFAAAIAGFCFRWPTMHQPKMFNQTAKTIIALWLAAPIIGSVFGVGTGLLFHRPWLGAAVGCIAAVLIDAFLLLMLAVP